MKPKRAWTSEDTSTLIRMNAVGYTDGEIARVTGHAAITVFYRRRHLGLSASRRKDWTRQAFSSPNTRGRLQMLAAR